MKNWKIDIFGWFKESWDKLIGRAVERLTEADGEAGLSWEDIQITARLMKKAEVDLGTGAERKEWVMEQMEKVLKIALPHLLELAFAVALNYANSIGDIKLGGSKD